MTTMRRSSLHPVAHDVGDDVDELALSSSSATKSASSRTVSPSRRRQVAADADVEEGRVRPQLGPDALLAGLAVGVLLDQPRTDLAQGRLDRLADAGQLVLGVEAAADR